MSELYKFLKTGLESQCGNFQWKLGQWEKIDGHVELCSWGFHGSDRVIDAFRHVPGVILAIAEVRGESVKSSDKQVWSEMRITKAYHWKKADSVALATAAAEAVLDIYERLYPNDDRPRKAIEAAKKYLEDPRYDARAANAAYAAYAAAYAAANAAAYAAADAAARAANAAAYAAADAAYAAADAAADAAGAAARAANAAAYAAGGAVASAATYNAALAKIEAWIQQRITTLTPYA